MFSGQFLTLLNMGFFDPCSHGGGGMGGGIMAPPLYLGNYICYNSGQKLLRKALKTASYLKPQAIENSFKRVYGEVEYNIIIYIERLKRLRILGLMSHVTIITRTTT